MYKLGIIADDFTGATDIAGFLTSNGITTVQMNGISPLKLNDNIEAIVVSLKSRSLPAPEAIRKSLDALSWLKKQGCTQFYFKYCSTFDSTPKGNIGPVTDALMEALGCETTILCPALPVNGRTVYQGYLFVHDTLLNESGMKNHPLTPMLDAKISRLMEAQAKGQVFEIHLESIEKGENFLRGEIENVKQKGASYIVLDAISQKHLDIIAGATENLILLTGGSGLAESMAKAKNKTEEDKKKAMKGGTPTKSKTVILSGSCSQMTNRQVNAYKPLAPSLSIDIGKWLNDSSGYIRECTSWVNENLSQEHAPLIYATKPPEMVDELQARFPHVDIGKEIETFFAMIAPALIDIGIKNFITAGGETSGVVAQNLGIKAFLTGPQIDPGVPWVKALEKDIYLALKSGNFGSVDFFKKAQEEFFHE